jgi:hypothetical protein
MLVYLIIQLINNRYLLCKILISNYLVKIQIKNWIVITFFQGFDYYFLLNEEN